MKEYLSKLEWTIVAGDPPHGTDHIPVFEMHDSDYVGKGSKGSKKIDLLAYKKKYFLLIELKGKYAQSDIKKLDELISNEKWRYSFVNELKSKKIITKIDSDLDIDMYIKSTKFLIKAIGYNYVQKPTPNEFLTFYFHNAVDSMPTITFGNNFSKNDEIVQLFKVF